MTTALIIFGSTTGNTESVSDTIAKIVTDRGAQTTVMNVADSSVEELGKDYDLILLGCSTWGEEEIELQDDFVDFYESMTGAPLSGKRVAVFGCGDSSYTYFCGAVDVIQERAEQKGAVIVCDPLKIDGDPNDAADEIQSWAEALEL